MPGSSDHDHNHSDHEDNNPIVYDASGHVVHDGSGNVIHYTTNIHFDVSGNVVDVSRNIFDISYSISMGNIFDVSGATHDDCSFTPVFQPIVDFSMNLVIDGSGYTITDQQGWTADGSFATISKFLTTDVSSDVQITENLEQLVTTYNDEIMDPSINAVFSQIQMYASEIKCSDFHGKGSIDDYQNLFVAAAKIANETKQMELDIDVEGFSEFGQAADELSVLFNTFIIKLQNVSIINDYNFLLSISSALGKIVNLSNIFGKFKETVLATTSIQVPKSAHDTKIILSGVMDEINCVMQYIGHFVDASFAAPVDCQLSAKEKNIINQAVVTIDNWNVLCEQGVSISLQHNPDIQFITHASQELVQTTNVLKNASQKLKSKLSKYNFC
jgi:hypothetical protein